MQLHAAAPGGVLRAVDHVHPFSLLAQSEEAHTDLTTCEVNLPLGCSHSLFKPVPVICVTDVRPSII